MIFFSIPINTLDGNTRALSHSSLTLFFVCRMNHVVSCRWATHKTSVVWIASFFSNSFRLTCIKLSLDRYVFGGLIHFKIYFSAWVRWLHEFSAYEKPVCFTFSACIVLLRDSLHVWQKNECEYACDFGCFCCRRFCCNRAIAACICETLMWCGYDVVLRVWQYEFHTVCDYKIGVEVPAMVTRVANSQQDFID